MIVTTLNIRGWTSPKTSLVSELVNSSDVLCLTEIWGDPSNNQIPQDSALYSAIPPDSPSRFRSGGGVSMIVANSSASRLLDSIATASFQLVSISYHGTPVVGCYLTPRANESERKQFFFHLTRMSRGASIALGDFNARSKDWDTMTNKNGSDLANWARMHRFELSIPPAPTCHANEGRSTVDLVASRSLHPIRCWITEQASGLSDHKVVSADIALSTARTLDVVPLTLLNSPIAQKKASQAYLRRIPQVITTLDAACTKRELEEASVTLARETLHPWLRMRKPTPGRFRPGWSRELDNASKERSKLLKMGDTESKRRAKILDKEIRRRVRKNKAKLRTEIGDCLESGRPEEKMKALKRLLDLEKRTLLTTKAITPESFTEEMMSRQPETAPVISTEHFSIDATFESRLVLAITSAKTKKAPGPDKIRTEMLQIEPELFAKSLTALWKAVGRVAFVPTILRSGLFAPIFKKGDPTLPANYRPINLLSGFRRIISRGITTVVEREYAPHPNQWGFLKGSNTETAVAFAVNNHRKSFPIMAALDLRQAYDVVPRHLLWALIKERLSANLAAQISPLLATIRARTKGQTGIQTATITAGVPQGDPISPILFDLFMDPFLNTVNAIPNGIASCFADDVILLGQSPQALQALLDASSTWAQENGMRWNVPKCAALWLPELFFLAETEIPAMEEAEYLGITLKQGGIGHSALLGRLGKATKTLSMLMRATERWKMEPRDKRNYVRGFVFSQTDYLLSLQPISPPVLLASSSLEAKALAWILGVKISQAQMNRARSLARLPSLRIRRMSQMARMISKFRSHIFGNENTETLRSKRNYSLISEFGTISAALRTNLKPLGLTLDADDTMRQAQEMEKEALLTEIRLGNAGQSRSIPPKKLSMPPVFRSDLDLNAKRRAALWYLNRLPAKTASEKAALPSLKTILEAEIWKGPMEEDCEKALYTFDLHG